MVAPAPHNVEPLAGSFGRPLRRSQSTTLTDEEFRGLQKLASYGSCAAALRRLLGPTVLEYLARVGRGDFEIVRERVDEN